MLNIGRSLQRTPAHRRAPISIMKRIARIPTLHSPRPVVTFDPTQPALVGDQLSDKMLHDLLQEDLAEAIRDSVDATLASIVYTGRCFRRLGSPPCSWCSISSRRPTQPVAAEEPATITFTLNAPSPPHAHRLGLVLIRQGYDRVRGCHTLVVVKVWDRPCPLIERS